jgi:NADPH:quinone reductase-like Zn-dependent oxidoreductase
MFAVAPIFNEIAQQIKVAITEQLNRYPQFLMTTLQAIGRLLQKYGYNVVFDHVGTQLVNYFVKRQALDP